MIINGFPRCVSQTCTNSGYQVLSFTSTESLGIRLVILRVQDEVYYDTVVHLGHILSFDNLDTADILFKARDLVRKANLMLHTFSAEDPLVKSCLFKFYCLSLYGCSLWNLSCHSLCSIEVSFNNIYRRIWNLPHNCYTGILHLTALLPSISTWSNPGPPLSFPVHCLVPLMLSRQFFVTLACWLLLKLGLMSFANLYHHQLGISVLKLSIIFIFVETHQRSMT